MSVRGSIVSYAVRYNLNNTGEVNSSLHILPESRISMSMSV
jgi:hypothetical protein